MIVEQRDYHVSTGKLPELVRHVRDRGDRDPAAVPRRASSARSRRTSARSRRTPRSGRYESYAERERRRAELQQDEQWKDFLAKIQPLIHTQQNRILIPTSFSPLK